MIFFALTGLLYCAPCSSFLICGEVWLIFRQVECQQKSLTKDLDLVYLQSYFTADLGGLSGADLLLGNCSHGWRWIQVWTASVSTEHILPHTAGLLFPQLLVVWMQSVLSRAVGPPTDSRIDVSGFLKAAGWLKITSNPWELSSNILKILESNVALIP